MLIKSVKCFECFFIDGQTKNRLLPLKSLLMPNLGYSIFKDKTIITSVLKVYVWQGTLVRDLEWPNDVCFLLKLNDIF